MSKQSGSSREVELQDLGIDVGSPGSFDHSTLHIVNGDASLAFSGYGEFTPITISSETILTDADVERDQH